MPTNSDPSIRAHGSPSPLPQQPPPDSPAHEQAPSRVLGLHPSEDDVRPARPRLHLQPGSITHRAAPESRHCAGL